MITLDDVAAGLAAGEFFLDYLPTVRLDDGRCVGCEALVRWRRPLGVAAPGTFIPLVENTPLAEELTFWVMGRAAADLGGWLRATDGVHVAVNVPPGLLGRAADGFAGRPAVPADLTDKLVLEVHERVVSDGAGVDALNRAAGGGRFRVALDEVGASGAGFAVLSRVRVPVLKLARSVTAQLGSAAADGFVRDVAGFARVTGAEVVAVGVERSDQAAALRRAGVSMAQGWLYSHPISAAGIAAYHSSRQLGSVR